MRIISYFLSVIFCISLLGKNLQDPHPQVKAPKTLPESQVKAPITSEAYFIMVKPDEHFVIDMPTQPSTGAMIFDPIISCVPDVPNSPEKGKPGCLPAVRFVERHPVITGPRLVGASGVEQFTFKAINIREGFALITFITARPWDVADAYITQYFVQIKASPHREPVPLPRYNEVLPELRGSVGKKFEIRIANNQTIAPANQKEYQRYTVTRKNVISKVTHKWEPPTGQLMGAPGNDLFTFKAVGKGETILSLIYERGIEDKEVIEERYKIIVS